MGCRWSSVRRMPPRKVHRCSGPRRVYRLPAGLLQQLTEARMRWLPSRHVWKECRRDLRVSAESACENCQAKSITLISARSMLPNAPLQSRTFQREPRQRRCGRLQYAFLESSASPSVIERGNCILCSEGRYSSDVAAASSRAKSARRDGTKVKKV